MKDAQSWMTKAVRLIRLIDKEPGPYHSCVKQVVWPLLGFEVGPCRVPQAVLSEEEVAHARARPEESVFAQELAREEFQLSWGSRRSARERVSSLPAPFFVA